MLCYYIVTVVGQLKGGQLFPFEKNCKNVSFFFLYFKDAEKDSSGLVTSRLDY